MAAKGFWETLHTWGHQPSSTQLPYEGWTLWMNTTKLTSLNRDHLQLHSQSQYSTQYWAQATKLNHLIPLIDWEVIGWVRQKMHIHRHIWMTKWATGWLSMGSNMKKWKQWASDQCPVCNLPSVRKTSNHLMLCGHTQTQTLISKQHQHILIDSPDLVALGFPIQEALQALFPLAAHIPTPINPSSALEAQQSLGPKWTACGMVSIKWKGLGPQSTMTTSHRYKFWLQTIVAQFWQLAWDLWTHRNEEVHHAEVRNQYTILYQAVQRERDISPSS